MVRAATQDREFQRLPRELSDRRAAAAITSDTNVDVLVKLMVAPAASIERIVADQPMRAVKGP